ncbi:MAG: hypothetical protein Q9180_003353, partial [Flavoplaca navasiana]
IDPEAWYGYIPAVDKEQLFNVRQSQKSIKEGTSVIEGLKLMRVSGHVPQYPRSEVAWEDHRDLISFLGYMQYLGVDFLPIKWHPGLKDVGTGGSARVSQAPFNLETSFAFKRLYFDGTNTEECYERATKEASILRHVHLIHHFNMVRLEAFCLEILARPVRLSPVLIFNKFPLGNLQEYLLVNASVTVEERIRFCADTARALAALHALGIIHGDVKPLNALVFERDGKRIVKLADFGDASICDNDESLALLPKSVPWDPPEHHFRGFPYKRARAMDIYSFGLLCLWVTLGDYLYLSLADPRLLPCGEHPPDIRHTTVDTLAIVKEAENIQEVAKECVLACESLTPEQRSNLANLFTLTLAKDPNARSTDFHAILKMLGDNNDTGIQISPRTKIVSGRWVTEYVRSYPHMDDPPKTHELDAPLNKHWAPSMRQITTKNQSQGLHPSFKLAGYMTVLLSADRRIRVSILRELIGRHWTSKCCRCKEQSALQVALSYRTGYGTARDLEQSHKWLKLSGKTEVDLEQEVEYARILVVPPYRSERLRDQSQFIIEVDHAHEYRMARGESISEIKVALASEARDIGVSFGETHNMTVVLKRTLARVLNKYGLYDEAAPLQEGLIERLKSSGDTDSAMKVLADLCLTYSLQDRLQLAEHYREEVAEYFTQNLGQEHMGTLGILTNLAHTQTELGHLTRAEATLTRVVAVASRVVGIEHQQTLAANSVLAAVYFKQGRLALAESLQSQILEVRVRTLGANHESTWYSMANLATLQFAQGRYNAAEEAETRIVALRTELLGASHPNTLTSMYNLARTYGKKQRLEMEEEMLRKVLEGRKAVLYPKHTDTITTSASLARNLQLQTKFKEAECLGAEVVQLRIEKFGKAHPSVLASRNDLMWILHDCGKYAQAEAVQLDNITLGSKERGAKNPNVLRCMSALASMYKVHGRLQESIAIYRKVLQTRSEVMGTTHRDTVKTAQDIEIVEGLIERLILPVRK